LASWAPGDYGLNLPSNVGIPILGDGQTKSIMIEIHYHNPSGMHMTGTRMVNELIRDSEVIHTSAVEVFDFDQQGSYRVPMTPYEVKPGDTFRTSCYYRDGTEFGHGSREEMCGRFGLVRSLCPFFFDYAD
jgi:hypothetical protein